MSGNRGEGHVSGVFILIAVFLIIFWGAVCLGIPGVREFWLWLWEWFRSAANF